MLQLTQLFQGPLKEERFLSVKDATQQHGDTETRWGYSEQGCGDCQVLLGRDQLLWVVFVMIIISFFVEQRMHFKELHLIYSSKNEGHFTFFPIYFSTFFLVDCYFSNELSLCFLCSPMFCDVNRLQAWPACLVSYLHITCKRKFVLVLETLGTWQYA